MVINPQAGHGRAVRAGAVAAGALRSAGVDLTVSHPVGPGASLAALSDAVAAEPDAVVVCGGDGMVHLAANVLAGGGIPLGLIRGGSGNDAADVLGTPDDPLLAARYLLDALAAGRVRRIDLGRCDGPRLIPESARAFVGLVYAGFDSAVNDRANRLRWPRGAARYNVALAIEMVRLRARQFHLELDERAMTVPATLVAVGNGSQYGGGKRIAPHACWDDGVLGVVVVGPVSRMTLARLAPTLPRAGHVGHPRVLLTGARRVLLDVPDGPMTVAYADGEAVGPLPIRAWTDPGALPVLVPVIPS